MRLAFVLLALLLVPLATATDYFIVIPDDGTTQDVINGANFAASMKGSTATTFESRTEEQITEENFDRSIIVMFDDDELAFMEGDRTSEEFLLASIVAYGEQQGFNVYEEDASNLWKIEEEIFCTQDVQECWDGSFVSRDIENNCAFFNCPEKPVEPVEQIDPPSLKLESGPEDIEPIEPAEPKSQGIFKRIWHWFAGIFI